MINMNRSFVSIFQRISALPKTKTVVRILEKPRCKFSTESTPDSDANKRFYLKQAVGTAVVLVGATVFTLRQQEKNITMLEKQKKPEIPTEHKQYEAVRDEAYYERAAKVAAPPPSKTAPKKKKKSAGGLRSGIGGPFELVSHEGATVTHEDLLGKWTLVYFGFTHCPDICPDELEKVSAAVKIIAGQRDMPNVPIYFITCDPLRDTPEVMKQYSEEISPSIIGLTGPEEKVLAACKQYRVYFSAGPKDIEGDYIVDHTVITYLMDPEGTCQAFYVRDSTVESVAKDMRTKITKWKPASES